MGNRKGHYCIVCGKVKSNESFSGKGHSQHICKNCFKKPPEKRSEEIAINKINKLYKYSNLSRQNKKMLNNFLDHKSNRVRKAAQDAYENFNS